jgi:uncharacterized protein YraI
VVSPVPLNVRYGTGSNHSIIGSLGNGSGVRIACRTDGTTVHGNYH